MTQRSATALVLSATALGQRLQLAREDTRLPWALDRIADLLASGSPPAAIASGLRDILLDRLDIAVPSGRPGTAWLLAWLLRNRRAPFTPVIAALTGAEMRVDRDPGSEREHRLTGAQAVALNVLDEDAFGAWSCAGLMMAGDLVAAQAELLLVPSRLGGWDGEHMKRIRSGEPAGLVLPGLVRTARSGRDRWPGDPAVTGAAVLSIAGRAIGIAREYVTRELITQIPA